MSLKDTLHMPSNAFPMRAGLAEKEPKMVQKWIDGHLYERMNENRVNAPVFMLHDGPPYANGDIHCGHALNRCLKDFIVRFKNMDGYQTPFVFGWDTHGLPIEIKVTKSGVNRKTTPVPQFRKICEDYARTQVEHQKGQIQRLGCLGDYEKPYLTLLPEFEARQIEVFATMALKGLIFKGVKPVYWSPSSESALAEAEVEYHDVSARTMYVAMDVKDGKGLIPEDASFLIWTTTPWTIPANQAIAANPKFEYGLFSTSKGKFVFLTSLQEKLSEELGLENVELLASFHGQDMEGATYLHPLYGRVSPIIVANYVTDDSGTGLVHIAPDHGVDDFNACLKYGIKPFCPVDEKGFMHLEEGDPCNGKFYEEANDIVVEELEKNGHLLKEIDIVHSYPHDWRTKKPVIFRATPQWFCSIDPIREELLQAIHEISWYPAWGEAKMANMIKDRADWCISRQRVWGVPIPIIYNEDGSPIIEKGVFDHIRELIAAHGSNIWFEKEAVDLLPEGYTNPASPNGLFKKETDIMDVWFDSGSSWNGTLVERGLKYPSDLYLEGADQYRGWFNSSLIVSMAVNGVPPFRSCVTHGWVMDEKWAKMSKSAGNGIDPNKLAAQYGADILRLWAASVDYHADVRLGESIIQTTTDNYRKIRNTFKFMIGNLDGYVPGQTVSYSLLDRFLLCKLEAVKNKALSCYNSYDFAGVVNSIVSFLSGDMSSFYLDYSKDILYCDSLSSPRRKAIQDVIAKTAEQICYLLAPILPFTMEEVHGYLPGQTHDAVQLEDMPKESHEFPKETLDLYGQFLSLRDVALKALEKGRAEGEYGVSSDAELSLTVASKPLLQALEAESEEMRRKFFMVARLSLQEGKEDQATAKASEGLSCPRCRTKADELHHHEEGEVCLRCLHALMEEGK
ncbi:MAG: isoleucine--tRNA ligase [Candidatus Enteromonas sp.]|nr:isoleucine--tRNA ligase [Candidatus Enteromonas sp.]